jgi:hypothetical protein
MSSCGETCRSLQWDSRRAGEPAMGTPEPDKETRALLAMAHEMRHALTQRDESVRPYRERYDRAQDLRMMPEKRIMIAAQFVEAAHRAEHLYQNRLAESFIGIASW